jgi:hypothetical protein
MKSYIKLEKNIHTVLSSLAKLAGTPLQSVSSHGPLFKDSFFSYLKDVPCRIVEFVFYWCWGVEAGGCSHSMVPASPDHTKTGQLEQSKSCV